MSSPVPLACDGKTPEGGGAPKTDLLKPLEERYMATKLHHVNLCSDMYRRWIGSIAKS